VQTSARVKITGEEHRKDQRHQEDVEVVRHEPIRKQRDFEERGTQVRETTKPHSVRTNSNGLDTSILSTMEQDRKKIQLLQQNLMLEKEYNKDLNVQLSMQMDRIKA
jgi:hypothetical protein